MKIYFERKVWDGLFPHFIIVTIHSCKRFQVTVNHFFVKMDWLTTLKNFIHSGLKDLAVVWLPVAGKFSQKVPYKCTGSILLVLTN